MNTPQRASKLYPFLASLLTALAFFLVLSGVAYADSPPQDQAGADPGTDMWLVLDPAMSEEEAWPVLAQALSRLKMAGQILDFNPRLQRSAPDAVPAAFVVASPDAHERLLGLPGVLDVASDLPPAPPAAGEISALGASGIVAGVVLDRSTTQPIPGAPIRVYDAVSFASLGNTNTDASGQYSLTVTAPYSQAKVYADPSGYVPGWHNGLAGPGTLYSYALFFRDARAVALTGGPQTDVNLGLSKGGKIAVTLTLDGGGTPPDDIVLSTYDAHTWATWGTSSQVGPGQYLVSLLPTSQYVVQFAFGDMPGIATEYYQDQTSKYDATPIAVTDGMTTPISAQVALKGIISGTVTDKDTSAPIAWAQAYAENRADSYWDWTISNASGQYYFAVPPDAYRLNFWATGYAEEWYDDKTSVDDADWVTVTAGSTVIANAALSQTTVVAPSGVITGMITKNGGDPLDAFDHVEIRVLDSQDGWWLISKYFYGNGSAKEYSVNTGPGTFKVFFDGTADGDPVGGYYDAKVSFDAADVVTVTEGSTVPDVNFDTSDSIYGCITGTVTSNGAPCAGSVRVIAWEGDSYAGSIWSIAPSDNGVYEICGLEPGGYRVSFSQFPSATTWYDGAATWSSAATVTVGVGQTVPDIDGALDDLGSCVSGQVVYAPNMYGLSDATVYLKDADGSRVLATYPGDFGSYHATYGSTSADKDGGFVICGLAPGSYTAYAYGYPMGDYSFRETGSFSVGQGESVEIGQIVLGDYAGLSITKSVIAGGEEGGTLELPVSNVVTYTIEMESTGTEDVTGVAMTDTIPSGVSFDNWVVRGGAMPLTPTDVITWTGVISANTTHTIRFTARVAARDYGGRPVVNTASFTSDDAGSGSDDASFNVAPTELIYLPVVMKNS